MVSVALGLAVLFRITQIWESVLILTTLAALPLRAMNMVYEGLRQKGSMIIVPSSAVETMGLGALGGLTAFDRILGENADADEADSDIQPNAEEHDSDMNSE